MSAIPKITSAMKTFAGKPLGIVSKALGAATCAAVIYDAHKCGKETAISKDRLDTADRFEKDYKQYLVSGSESATVANLKKFWFESRRGLNCPHILSRTGGYLGGFGGIVLKELPLVALSVVAIKFDKIGKIAGLLLAANGVKTLVHDIAGVGSSARDK